MLVTDVMQTPEGLGINNVGLEQTRAPTHTHIAQQINKHTHTHTHLGRHAKYTQTAVTTAAADH